MKRLVSFAVLLGVIACFAGCGILGNNHLATADSKVEMSNEFGSVSLDESVVKTLLGAYPEEALGLKKNAADYYFRLSNTRVNEQDGCLAEAFESVDAASVKEAVPEASFAIVGMDVYILDGEEFKLLTLNNGLSEASTDGTSQADSNATTQEAFDEVKNEDNARKLFEKYSADALGLEGSVRDYTFTLTTATGMAYDGSTVYVIRVYNADGEFTGVTVGINDDGEYLYDSQTGVYAKLG